MQWMKTPSWLTRIGNFFLQVGLRELLPLLLRPLPHPFPRPPPLAASQPPLLHPRLWIFLHRCINELPTPFLPVLLNLHISVLLEEPPLLEA